MKSRSILKVCGMRDPDNIRAVEALHPDMIGFIFYPKSPRCVDMQPGYLPTQCERVGVFVDATYPHIREAIDAYRLDYVQLHGSESPELCSQISPLVHGVIKTFSIASAADIDATGRYEGVCRYFLFDTACAGYGGSGQQFEWGLLSDYSGTTPFLLSGGISLDSIAALSKFSHPQLAGIDINSKFEISPGLKDISKVKLFIESMI